MLSWCVHAIACKRSRPLCNDYRHKGRRLPTRHIRCNVHGAPTPFWKRARTSKSNGSWSLQEHHSACNYISIVVSIGSSCVGLLKLSTESKNSCCTPINPLTSRKRRSIDSPIQEQNHWKSSKSKPGCIWARMTSCGLRISTDERHPQSQLLATNSWNSARFSLLESPALWAGSLLLKLQRPSPS